MEILRIFDFPRSPVIRACILRIGGPLVLISCLNRKCISKNRHRFRENSNILALSHSDKFPTKIKIKLTDFCLNQYKILFFISSYPFTYFIAFTAALIICITLYSFKYFISSSHDNSSMDPVCRSSSIQE